MYLIVGLGNPEGKYRGTRHNVGFSFVDKIIDRIDFPEGTVKLKEENQFKSALDQVTIDGEKAILAKPMTYMNKSGEAIAKLMAYYKIDPKNIIVASDDCNLAPGTARMRFSGEDGGHNGLKSIIASIGPDFWRVRIGVGAPDGYVMLEDYVLAKIPQNEVEIIANTVDKSVDYVIDSISRDSFENITI
jgi:PTH1 family peptidyl-tRNA hydrolase